MGVSRGCYAICSTCGQPCREKFNTVLKERDEAQEAQEEAENKWARAEALGAHKVLKLEAQCAAMREALEYVRAHLLASLECRCGPAWNTPCPVCVIDGALPERGKESL